MPNPIQRAFTAGFIHGRGANAEPSGIDAEHAFNRLRLSPSPPDWLTSDDDFTLTEWYLLRDAALEHSEVLGAIGAFRNPIAAAIHKLDTIIARKS